MSSAIQLAFILSNLLSISSGCRVELEADNWYSCSARLELLAGDSFSESILRNNINHIEYTVDFVRGEQGRLNEESKDPNGLANNWAIKSEMRPPRISAKLIDINNNIVGYNGVIDENTLVSVAKESFTRPIRLFKKKLLSPIDVAIGVYSEGPTRFYDQLYMFDMYGTTANFNEIEIRRLIDYTISNRGPDKDFSTIILGGSAYDAQNNVLYPSHAAAILIAHNYGNSILLMDFAGPGIYNCIANGRVVANPRIFGNNLANEIICLNRYSNFNSDTPHQDEISLNLQSNWACAYHVINFVKTTNKYWTLNSIIMENGPNFIIRLQPKIFNEFLNNDIMELDRRVRLVARSAFFYGNLEITGKRIESFKSEREYDDLIEEENYYVVNIQTCKLFLDSLNKALPYYLH